MTVCYMTQDGDSVYGARIKKTALQIFLSVTPAAAGAFPPSSNALEQRAGPQRAEC